MSRSTIKSVTARQIIDCKCRPLVEVDIVTEDGTLGRGCAPTGSSVGMHESFVLRDNDPKEYSGMSVHKAVANVTDIIAPALIGRDVTDQARIDSIMIGLDGTENKRRLGGNAIYSTSIASYRAAAELEGKPLYEYIAGGPIKTVPVPSYNMINGGKYPGVTQAFNEFILLPYRARGIEEAVEIGVKVYHQLRPVLRDYMGREPVIGPSYGWVAPSEDPEVVLGLMARAVEQCGYTDQVAFALDCASSEMYDKETGLYYLNGRQVTSRQLVDYAAMLSEKYKLMFVEDLLDENDWEGYRQIPGRIVKTNIIGDDWIATNRARLARAISEGAIDGFILKPNQVGTITEALDAYRYAKERNLITVPSGRSGGVINDVIMDFAVGLQVGFIKNGCPKSGERIDKLNFLIRACSLNEGCKMADISSLVKF